jgi:spore germination protein AB
MDINVKVKPNLQIRAFYLFFVIAGIQIGVGIIGAPKFVFAEAERDSWLAILIGFLFMCIVVGVMFFILNQYENADYFGIHVDLFGKWIGKFLGTLIIIYLGASFLSILMTYIQVVQIFLYHGLANWIIATLIMILVLYTVFGGIRVVVGVTFVFFIITFSLLSVLYDPLFRLNMYNYLPMFQASLPELLKGAKATAYTFAGFEILMIVYPFVSNKRKAKLPVYLGLTFTTLIFIFITMLSIGYFSAKGLKNIDWALLILVKSASFTFLERLDYIVVIAWLMVIIPNLVLLMWAIAYGMKRLYKFQQRKTHYVFTAIILFAVNYFQYGHEITKLTDFIARTGFWIVYIYPLLLLPIVLVKKKLKSSGRSKPS